MKLGGLIPLALGKLTFIGITALMTSKLSLLIMGIMGLKKLFSGADGGASHTAPQGYHYQDSQAYQQAYYGDLHGQGAMQIPATPQSRKRVAYVIRGRQLGGKEFWSSHENPDENVDENSPETLSVGSIKDSITTVPELPTFTENPQSWLYQPDHSRENSAH